MCNSYKVYSLLFFAIKGPQLRVLMALVALFMACVTARAWGLEGHQVVALVAQAQLSPKAAAAVARLLAQEPGATMASQASWADEHRTPATRAWHYVNFPRGNCHYEVMRDCPDGQCVVEETRKQIEVLRSDAGDAHKLLALKYLIHFVADVHQPLHAGFLDDRGGNMVSLQTFMRASNLHAVWDAGLIHYLGQSPQWLASRVQILANGLAVADLDPAHAAEESCAIVAQPGFYPQGLVDAGYIARYTPVLEQRLALAGARLAGLLNGLFQ
jgi:hypothetical protein